MSPGSRPSPALPDASARNLASRVFPPGFLPYVQLARWDRPIGWQLLVLPCWWSSTLASVAAHQGPQGWRLLLFLAGAIAMRGAGCTYNDIIDRHIDAQVARTRGRPLPSGRVSLNAAKAFLVAQCLVGFCVLISFNWFSIFTGLASLAIVAAYPFMKRITSWPQLVLGFAFAWGAWMGWTAMSASLSWTAALIYLAAISWTIGYDTIYALQDSSDDAIAGIKSTARLFGARVRLWVAVFYAGAALALAAAIFLAGGGVWAWLGWAGFAAHLGWQAAMILPADGARALMLFRSNWHAGLLLSAGLLVQAVAG